MQDKYSAITLVFCHCYSSDIEINAVWLMDNCGEYSVITTDDKNVFLDVEKYPLRCGKGC